VRGINRILLASFLEPDTGSLVGVDMPRGLLVFREMSVNKTRSMHVVSVLMARGIERRYFSSIPRTNSTQSGNLVFYQLWSKDEVKVGKRQSSDDVMKDWILKFESWRSN
jgi:hypothetical protein